MLVFPPNPNSGDVFEPGGGLPTWLWDGEKWTHPSLPVLPPPLEITTTSLPQATAGVAYSAQLEATGGTPPHTWMKIGGSAEWASVSPAGAVTGTPTGSGVQNIVARVTDSRFKETEAVVNIALPSGPLAITTTNFGPGLLSGVPMSVQLEATGGIPPYTWEERDADVFALMGLTLSPSGLVTGAPHRTANTSIFVRVTDSASATVTRNVSLVVGQGPLAGIYVQQGSQLKATYSNGEAIDRIYFAAIGGTAPHTWGTSGDKPSWITQSGPSIYGIVPPTFSGPIAFDLTVRDNTSTTVSFPVQFNVIVGPLTIAYPAVLQAGNVNSYYWGESRVMGGTPPYTWSASGLPDGIALGLLTPQSVVHWSFNGAPTEEGTFNVTITVTDNAGGTDSATLPLTINPALPLENYGGSAWASLSDGSGGMYNILLSASNGTQPYTWSFTGNGWLPGSPNLDPNMGAIDGYADQAGEFWAEVMVTDDVGATAVANANLSVANGETRASVGGETKPKTVAKKANARKAPVRKVVPNKRGVKKRG